MSTQLQILLILLTKFETFLLMKMIFWSLDVTALFTNVPLDETINILVNKAFPDDWFNKTYGLNLQKDQLVKFLEIATTNQLFQFDGQLYEQTDGVAMGSPLGLLMVNVFMCHLEEKLTRDGLIPQLYRRYVDDTLARMPNTDAATMFLTTLNGLHPSLSFTMELSVDDRIPFIGIEIIKNGTKLETQVYRKPTNTGLLLHLHSHTDKRYKDSLLKTMLHLAYALSSTTEAFNEECAKLRSIFSRLDYPLSLFDSVISNFDSRKPSVSTAERNADESNIVRINLPFKDQVSANSVRRQLRDLSNKVGLALQPVFVSKKLEQDLKPKEAKLSIVNQQCVVYHVVCDLCDADYVRYTARHLFQRAAEHKNSAIGKHFHEAHGRRDHVNGRLLKILRKCQANFYCLVFEMLYIKKFKPNLNVPTPHTWELFV